MHKKNIKIIKGILLEQIGKQHEAIRLVNKELEKKTTKSANFIFALRLIRMVSYHDIGEHGKCRDEFYSLLNDSNYIGLYEYGFLLRNAELVLGYKECLPYIIDSIKVFQKFGALQQVAFSRIGYAVHLALIGKLGEATKQLSIGDTELSGLETERHTILNNQAVIQLFKKNSSDEVKETLQKALKTATLDFDRITILVNYLLLMDWRDEDDEVEKTINEIECILVNPSFADKKIIRSAYFNIHKYYERKKYADLSSLYRRKIDSLSLPITSLWEFFLNDKPVPVEDQEHFRSTINRAVGFLTYWNMDVDSSLMRYK